MREQTNYFAPGSAAERYARGRPFFHAEVVQRLAVALALDANLSLAVDIGCGTGLSSRALAAVADQVIGLDPSVGMLRQATDHPQTDYVAAAAEAIPLPDSCSDLVTLSSVFHWLQRERFLPEAHRVLSQGGWLVIYDNYFYAHMVGNPEFQSWSRGSYLTRYPSPARDRRPFEDADARSFGFEAAGSESYTNEIGFNVDGLVDYLLTQSNVISAVEGGREDLAQARSWLMREVRPFFGSDEETFTFGGPIAYYRRLPR